MTIQGQALAITAAAPGLPDEIGFLLRHGVGPERLRRASAIAESCGVTADRALLRHGLMDEAAFYRALAAELGLPFLPAVTADPKAPFPHGVRAGRAPLAPGSDSDLALAPEGAAIARLLARRGSLRWSRPRTTRRGPPWPEPGCRPSSRSSSRRPGSRARSRGR